MSFGSGVRRCCAHVSWGRTSCWKRRRLASPRHAPAAVFRDNKNLTTQSDQRGHQAGVEPPSCRCSCAKGWAVIKPSQRPEDVCASPYMIEVVFLAPDSRASGIPSLALGINRRLLQSGSTCRVLPLKVSVPRRASLAPTAWTRKFIPISLQ